MYAGLFIIINICVFLLSEARLLEQIYVNFNDVSENCYLILNGTHQFGCQSSLSGNSGVVAYYYDDNSDKNIEAKFDASVKLIVAIDLFIFNEKAIRFLKQKRVNGVLLLVNNQSLTLDMPLSEDSTCPNQAYSLYGNKCEKKWNSAGALTPNGFRFTDFKKPIFLVKNETISRIITKHCYEKFNRNGTLPGKSLCSARLSSHMSAAGSAEICMRRNEQSVTLTEIPNIFCSALTDYNIISINPPLAIKNKPQRFMFIATRMDSFSSFSYNVLGESSVLKSIISIIAVTEVIGRNIKMYETLAKSSNRALVFAFFHGESLDYIGSGRTVFDMLNNEFPVKIESLTPDIHTMNISDVDAFLEVQIISRSNSFTAHVDGQSYLKFSRRNVNEFINAAQKALFLDGYKMQLHLMSNISSDTQLPPSSLQMFLAKQRNISGLLLASFNESYGYKKLNSFGDLLNVKDKAADIEQISAAATAALGAALQYVYGDKSLNAFFQIDKKFVNKLYDCFISAPDWETCSLFQEILKENREFSSLSAFSRKLKETSIGVDRQTSVIRVIVQALLVYTLGSKDLVNVNTPEQCSDLNGNAQLYYHTWQRDPDKNSSICYRNSMYITPAKSPAFDIDDYDYKSGMYPTWVESQWDVPELVLFLSPPHSIKFDLLIFIFGCIWFMFSYAFTEVVYRSNKHFFDPSAPPPEADQTAAPL